ncbi:uncharacterized protein LOC144444645 [Glandiceps talaboti]
MSGEVTVNVKYSGGNLMPITCQDTDTICELATRLRQNAGVFDLKEDDIKLNKVRLYLRDDKGKKRKLEFNEKISVISEKCTVQCGDNLDDGVQCLVRYVNSEKPVKFSCKPQERVSDLMGKIRSQMGEFHLKRHDARQEKDSRNEIILKISNESGHKGKRVNRYETIGNLENTDLEFFFQKLGTKPTCTGVRNIAFFGAPGHGKSSTINTIHKMMKGSQKFIASTWTGSTTGTEVLSQYKFDMPERSFTFVDVPGAPLKQIRKTGGDAKADSIIKNILDGKMPVNEKLDYFVWYSPKAVLKNMCGGTGKIHGVVFVHKGTSTEVDKIGLNLISVAQKMGFGIPVLGIVTHTDKLTPEGITESVDHLSTASGIDKARIFTISNTDHTAQQLEQARVMGSSKEHVEHVLDGILSAAENYMADGKVTVD